MDYLVMKTNDEARMSNDEGMSNFDGARVYRGSVNELEFGLCHSFVLRHSDFVIVLRFDLNFDQTAFAFADHGGTGPPVSGVVILLVSP